MKESKSRYFTDKVIFYAVTVGMQIMAVALLLTKRFRRKHDK